MLDQFWSSLKSGTDIRGVASEGSGYEINLTDDVDLKDILRFLGQREIVHYQRFGEALMDVYEFTESKKNF